MQKDTIFALSTPQGVGGVAVIRISGPQAQAALQALFQPAGTSPMEPRKLIYGRFVFDGTQIDDGMAVLFCAPASYTGEDSAELHCHGSLAVVQQLLGALGTLPGLRPAEPGEFTKRAFLHGKMDLSQAEAVMDLIGAEGLAAARQSLSQLHGTLFAKVDGLCDALTLALAGIEAGLDFPEDDWEQAANEEGFASMSQILTEVTVLLRSYRAGRLVKQGVRCALVGRPMPAKAPCSMPQQGLNARSFPRRPAPHAISSKKPCRWMALCCAYMILPAFTTMRKGWRRAALIWAFP